MIIILIITIQPLKMVANMITGSILNRTLLRQRHWAKRAEASAAKEGTRGRTLAGANITRIILMALMILSTVQHNL